MSSPQSHLVIIQHMTEISERIRWLLGELQPITDQIMSGNYGHSILEKNVTLQEEIGRLDDLRGSLRVSFSR
ncbi:MAG: hypothetical protein O7I42_22490 [Alphaproteobacteria bacterium]|nr:hypothetical protein [Alphaproteobacteria bacterium]